MQSLRSFLIVDWVYIDQYGLPWVCRELYWTRSFHMVGAPRQFPVTSRAAAASAGGQQIKWSHQHSAYFVSEGAGFFDYQATIKVLLDLYRIFCGKIVKEVEISPKIEAALVDLPKKALYPSRARIARIVGQDYWEPLGRVVSNELTVSFFDTILEYIRIRIAKTIGRLELRKWMNMDYTNKLSEWEIKNRFLVVYILPVSHILQEISQKTKSQHCCYINFLYILSTVPHVTTPSVLVMPHTSSLELLELLETSPAIWLKMKNNLCLIDEDYILSLGNFGYDDMYVPEKGKTTASQTCKPPLTAWMESSFSAEHSSFFYGSSGCILWPCRLPGKSLCKPHPTCSFLAGTWFLRDCGGGRWFQSNGLGICKDKWNISTHSYPPQIKHVPWKGGISNEK